SCGCAAVPGPFGSYNLSKAAADGRKKRLLLLAGDRLGSALAGARVGVRALAADRKAPAMAKPAVAGEVHQPLDVHPRLAAKVALDRLVAVDRFANVQDFLVGQVL